MILLTKIHNKNFINQTSVYFAKYFYVNYGMVYICGTLARRFDGLFKSYDVTKFLVIIMILVNVVLKTIQC